MIPQHNSETITPVKPEVPDMELRIADRCDRCRAQAYVVVAVHGLTLLFCAHCFHEHEALIEASGHRVVLDQRDLLNPENVRSGEEVH